MKIIGKFCKNRRAASGIEYGFVLGLIALVAFGALVQTGGSLSDLFVSAGQEVRLTDHGGGAGEQAGTENEAFLTFSDIVDADTDTVYESSVVVVPAFAAGKTAFVTGQDSAALLINGVASGTSSVLSSGDLLSISMRSSPDNLIGREVVVRVGTEERVWTIVTKPDDEPDQFVFIEDDTTPTGSVVVSNEQTLTGFMGMLTADISGDDGFSMIFNGEEVVDSMAIVSDPTTVSLKTIAPEKGISKRCRLNVNGVWADWIVTGGDCGVLKSPEEGESIAQIAVGRAASYMLLSSGNVWSWGANTSGALGTGTGVSYSSVPVKVSGISGAAQISAGSDYACAALSSGTVKCWGANSSYQLGNGSNSSSPVPVTVSGITTATAVYASQLHTCARLSGGKAQCWGNNYAGRVGIGVSTISITAPRDVVGLVSGVAEMALGLNHSCARLDTGAVKCWGAGTSGQLGNNILVNQKSPVDVVDLTDAKSIAAAGNTTCVSVTGDDVRCWGNSMYVLAGNGSATYRVPTAVPGLSGSSKMFSGPLAGSMMGVSVTGTLKGGGSNGANSLALGNGNLGSYIYPAQAGLDGRSNITMAALGNSHDCVLFGDDVVACWGAGANGVLGLGDAFLSSKRTSLDQCASE